MCYVLKGLCEFSLSPSSFSFFSSPPPFGVFSLVPWLGRYKEIGGIYSLHWNSFSTQNDFLVFILWWGDSCSTVTAPQSLSDKDWFFLFAFEMPSIPTLYQPRMLKGKKMWQTGQLEILHHTLTSWSIAIDRALQQIRVNHYTESWLRFSAVQRRALWGSGRTNDLSRETFGSHCSLRSVGIRHCLLEERVEESLLPSPLSSPNPPSPEADGTEHEETLVWNDLM